MDESKTNDALHHENEELKRRLTEAEETLAAIRQGFVDAFVIQGKEGDQVSMLRGAEPAYRLLVEKMAEGAALLEPDGTILYCNRQFTQMLGLKFNEVIGTTLFAYIDPTDQFRARETLAQTAQGTYKTELEFRRGDGQTLPVYLSLSQSTSNGLPVISIVATDLTEHKHDERILSDEKLARLILDQAAEAIVVCDVKGFVIRSNQAASRLAGRALIGQHFDDCLPLWHAGRRMPAFDRETPGDIHTGCDALAPDGVRSLDVSLPVCGQELHLLMSSGPLYTGNKSLGWVFTLSDITQRRASEERIRHMAQHDALTGLPNRMLLMDRLQQGLALSGRRQRKLAVMLLDLDRFKTINDSLGHQVGDVVLQTIAARLSGCIRQGDTVARLGGDEFVVLLNDIQGPKDAGRTALQILEDIAGPIQVMDHQLLVTPSIGVACYPADGSDPDVLLKNADMAMYQAKLSGRDCYRFYTQQMSESADERLALGNALRKAITERQFEVYYQPQVDIKTGRLVAAEALLRWNHPEWGQLQPGRFIHVAEETGLITTISEWVLFTACQQNRKWQDSGLPGIRIAVNLSAAQLRQPSLPELVAAILAETRLAPDYLELELTESMVMENLEEISVSLGKIAASGVSISVDDFGTGYSSLTHLKKFPISKLKIDKSFVRDIVQDPDDAAITAAIIALCKNLDLKVTAEGVETEDQMAFLRKLECGIAQGFYFREPLSTVEFEQLLQSHAANPYFDWMQAASGL